MIICGRGEWNPPILVRKYYVKRGFFSSKNANFSNTYIILWLTFSATLHLGGGGGGGKCILSGIARMRGGREEGPCPLFLASFQKMEFLVNNI